jgi:pimeloyl-ACP methyl ester carboxylesterase
LPEEKEMPSTTPSATQPHLRLRRILIGLALVTILPAAAGAFYQSISELHDRRAHPMPGQLIDVGGYRMHVNCTGQGTPTVILDSGLGDSFLSWRKVQPDIARFTRVCSYDRAGLGYSDSSPRARTSQVFAEELGGLLHGAGVSPPYILVGHSMGGFDIRLYTSLYRSDVAGMVLVDSSHPEQQRRLPAELTDLDTRTVREQESLEFTIPFGIPRLMGFCGDDAEVRAAECNLHSVREAVAELKAVSESAAQAATAGTPGGLPLIVLSSDPDKPEPDLPADLVKPTNDTWEKMQEELVHLSTRSTQVIARNSGHYIQLDRPDLVIESVRQVVEQARSAQAAAETRP